MHRMKIGLAAAVVCFSSPSGVYASLTQGLSHERSRRGRAGRGAGRARRRRDRPAASGRCGHAGPRAGQAPDVVAVFDKTDETARREAAFAECEALNAGLQKEGRKAAIVAILGADGKVIARDLNPNAMWGDDLKAQVSRRSPQALQGRAGQGRLDDGRPDDPGGAGAHHQGRRHRCWARCSSATCFSAKLAQETARPASAPRSATSTPARCRPPASPSAGRSRKRRTSPRRRRSATCCSASREAGRAGAVQGRSHATLRPHVDIEGQQYAVHRGAAARQLLRQDQRRGAGSRRSRTPSSGSRRLATKVLRPRALAILVALGAVVLTAKRFIKPLDKIELGVAEIINGNIDYTFKPVGPDFEGLSNGLNVMLARLLGPRGAQRGRGRGGRRRRQDLAGRADDHRGGRRRRQPGRGGAGPGERGRLLPAPVQRVPQRAARPGQARPTGSACRPSWPSCGWPRPASSRSGAAAWSASSWSPRGDDVVFRAVRID